MTDAPTPNPQGFTINTGVVDGQTIAQWTEDWWRWALSSPLDLDPATTGNQNPLTDETGQFATFNNSGPVFFIAGESPALGLSDPVDRTFTVPAGKPLLIPLENFIDTPPEFIPNSNDLVLGDNPLIRATENFNIAQWDSHVTSLKAVFDGQEISKADLLGPVNTPFFDAGTSGANSVAEALLGAQAGTDMDPAKSGGYWLMISGLSPGTHTLQFGGTNDGFQASFGHYDISAGSQDITDTITVLPPTS